MKNYTNHKERMYLETRRKRNRFYFGAHNTYDFDILLGLGLPPHLFFYFFPFPSFPFLLLFWGEEMIRVPFSQNPTAQVLKTYQKDYSHSMSTEKDDQIFLLSSYDDDFFFLCKITKAVLPLVLTSNKIHVIL